ncbi:MAG: DNA polymerase III subunit delta' [Firmicutes bacterium HGW-Firmicutes-1]|jgi:DNA polymerase-3 subunit delta'|nr:MAG: DNA polymerase III subunit delta' [Firmicutes bacterium HGW-Firmicutes-1]
MNSFNDIVGHEEIIKHIRNSIKMDKVSHAYMFEGEEGIGKKLLASIFAKTLQCEAGKDEPCNSCSSCKSFDSLNHPDIKYVVATKKAGIGVDDIREQLNMDIHIKPYRYKYKIYMIEEGDTMTPQAQNALLKTIEEPPHYGIIIMIAHNSSRFLPTVLSRCVLLSLKAIEEKKIKAYLIENQNLSEAEAHMYASISRGNIGKAKTFLTSIEFEDIRNDIIYAMECIIEENDLEILEIAKKIGEYKEKADMVLDLMMTWLRDIMIIKEINDEKYIIHKDKYKTLLKHGQLLSYNRISVLMSRIEDMQRNIKVNVNYQLSLETLFF